jgi:hypothetical protein
MDNANLRTALMSACNHNIPEVALAILATGKSNPEARDKYGCDAMYYTKSPDLKYAIRRECAYLRRKAFVISLGL